MLATHDERLPVRVHKAVQRTLRLLVTQSTQGNTGQSYVQRCSHRLMAATVALGCSRVTTCLQSGRTTTSRSACEVFGSIRSRSTREAAKVTREVAGKLATPARNLELQHSLKNDAEFLTRCIFASFAEDVHLLPKRGGSICFKSLREDVGNFPSMAEALWQSTNAERAEVTELVKRNWARQWCEHAHCPAP